MKYNINDKEDNWKLNKRTFDFGKTEAICPHGVGHHKGIHGCDGCCANPPKDMWDKVTDDNIEDTTKPISSTGENGMQDRFNKEFIDEDTGLLNIGKYDHERLLDFITTLLEKQREEKELNISMLRQWLNEDRITDPRKMITNDDIKHWFKLNDKSL